MIESSGPVVQALLGTLLTWGLTAGGSAMVFILRGNQRKSLDAALGFSAGVMVAASFWSLLVPAIEKAEATTFYGENGEFAFAPVAIGFLLGSIFVFGSDKLISHIGISNPSFITNLPHSNRHQDDSTFDDTEMARPSISVDSFSDCISVQHSSTSRRRRKRSGQRSDNYLPQIDENDPNSAIAHWKRIMLLVVAITVHNIPEGLAVGVSFGAIGTTASATFEMARNLAIGIGIQNFPEGLAVSVPLHAAGFSMWKSFWYGQLSGCVEPIFGLIGAAAVTIAEIVLPYALSFAAGAMIYIVVDDIVPEAHSRGNGVLATWGAITGFIVMMCLDVGLG